MRKPVEVVKSGVIAVKPVQHNQVFIVTHRYDNNDIAIRLLNGTYSTIVDIDYLYENFKLYHSETEYLLYHQDYK